MKKQAVIVLKTDKDEQWLHFLNKKMPQLDVRCWPDVGDAAQVDYALLWDPPNELFDDLVNLKVIFSIGAGIDGILKVANRPQHVPLVRLSDKLLIEGMVHYVLYCVLRIHRNMADYDRLQREHEWGFYKQIAASDCRVGIMGLGQLGSACAQAVKSVGYHVNGYSRTLKSIEGVNCFDQTNLDQFLSQTDVLVCLLPLTDDTKHLLDKTLFKKLPQGAAIVNAGRGGHVCESDLIESLDSNQLNHAVLDVFETEPLPEDHPFWDHPKITLTPHVASQTVPASAVEHIIDGIHKHQEGRALDFLYDPELGY